MIAVLQKVMGALVRPKMAKIATGIPYIVEKIVPTSVSLLCTGAQVYGDIGVYQAGFPPE
jgi:hypothetical protein